MSLRRGNSITTILSLVAVLAVVAAPKARATVITQLPATLTQSTLTTDQTGLFHLAQFGGTFEKFNPSLGTLEAVTLSFSGEMTYDLSFHLTSFPCGQGCGTTFGISTGYWFNAPGFPHEMSDYTPDFFATVDWSGKAEASNLAPQTSGPLPLTPSFQGQTSDLAAYTGVGSVQVAGGIAEGSGFCSSGGLSCTLSNNLSLLTTLTYTYASTAVPEPPSVWIFLSSLIGMAVFFAPRPASPPKRG